MDEIVQLKPDLGVLRDPVLLSAFSVRRRAGRLAANTVMYLVEEWHAEQVARIDCEAFFDLTARRPVRRWTEDVSNLDWPEVEIYHARPAAAEHDFLLLVGFEPNYRWRTFVDIIARYMDGLGVKTMVNLRCLPATVPHTRPAPVIVAASDPELELQFGVQTTSYSDSGPADVGVVLSGHVAPLRWHTADLTVLQPEYFPRMPNAQASLALIKLIDRAFGTETPVAALREASEEQMKAIDAGLERDDGAQSTIQELEQRYDAGLERMDFIASEPDEASSGGELPSGRELIDEVERLLGGFGSSDDEDDEAEGDP